MSLMDTRPAGLALLGPTASGKTDLAMRWAERLGGEIVSVDSALVYRGLDIGSAKPEPELRQRVPHHLIDLREPEHAYSAADFRTDALAAIESIVARRRVPILVGGTGLYFRALFDGLSPMPPADAELRAKLLEEANASGWAALHAQLAQVDPLAAARIGAADAQRIQRALEVWRLSGRPISDWQRQKPPLPRLPARFLKLALWPPRETLRERIVLRFEQMLEQGLLAEVSGLMQRSGLHVDLPSMRSVGYRQAWEHLDGGSTAAEFRDRTVFATAQLAKRQRTWLRGEPDLLSVDTLSGAGQSRIELAIGAHLPT
jgi:tRNA dimethylallyltransferase